MVEIWFDGSIVIPVGDILREHAPHAVIFQGPQATLRWVGNENGFAPYPLWNAESIAKARSGVSTSRDSDPVDADRVRRLYPSSELVLEYDQRTQTDDA